jgi:hypothetical protein
MKEYSVNMQTWTSHFSAVQPQLIKDIEDPTICIVSAQEGSKNGSPTV